MKLVMVLSTLLFCVVYAQVVPQIGTVSFTPFVSKNCTGESTGNITISTGVCLNNHNFNEVSCSVLTSCLGVATQSYEELVSCTNAPAMSLSINITALTDGSLVVDTYALSKKCFGIPVPLNEHVGSCSTLFALNTECYPSGQFGFAASP